MADVVSKYDVWWLNALQRNYDWSGHVIRAAFLANTYTPDVANDAIWGDVAVHQITGAVNYPVGGPALNNKTLTAVMADADNVSLPDLTATFRYIVLYSDETVNGVVQPLWGYMEPTAGSDVVIQNSLYVIEWPTAGVFTLS